MIDRVYAYWGQRSSLLATLFALTIVVASFIPEDAPVAAYVSPVWGNTGHTALYMALTLCGISAMNGARRLPKALLAALIVSVMGLSIELLQPLFGRQMSYLDFVNNETGVLAAVVMVWVTRKVSFCKQNR